MTKGKKTDIRWHETYDGMKRMTDTAENRQYLSESIIEK